MAHPLKEQVRDDHTLVYNLRQTYYTAPPLEASKMQTTGLDPTQTIAIDFDRRKISGPTGKGGAPNLRGLSGGGIWRFSPYEEYTISSPPPLVGFLAGPTPKNKKAIFGARPSFLLSLIAEAR